MSAYAMSLGKDEFNSTTLNTVYPYYTPQPPKVRVVEEVITEEFDGDGKLVSRVKKTTTRYEEQTGYQQWYASGSAQPAIKY